MRLIIRDVEAASSSLATPMGRKPVKSRVSGFLLLYISIRTLHLVFLPDLIKNKQGCASAFTACVSPHFLRCSGLINVLRRTSPYQCAEFYVLILNLSYILFHRRTSAADLNSVPHDCNAELLP